jgi:hypothetical protein
LNKHLEKKQNTSSSKNTFQEKKRKISAGLRGEKINETSSQDKKIDLTPILSRILVLTDEEFKRKYADELKSLFDNMYNDQLNRYLDEEIRIKTDEYINNIKQEVNYKDNDKLLLQVLQVKNSRRQQKR